MDKLDRSTTEEFEQFQNYWLEEKKKFGELQTKVRMLDSKQGTLTNHLSGLGTGDLASLENAQGVLASDKTGNKTTNKLA
jgi:hypothetical protein